MKTTEQNAGAFGEFQGYIDGEPSIKWFDRARMPQVGDRIFAVPASAGTLTSYGLPARIDGVDLGPMPPARVEGGDTNLVTVSFNDLMALARRLIAEQLDGVDEEFMAGRAHGIGSLHSEILMLAKGAAPAQAQDETAGDAGAAQTCRSSEKVQVMQEQSDAGLARQSPEGGGTLAPVPLRSVENLVAMLVDRDTPPGMDDEVVDWDLHGKPITRRMVESFSKTTPRPDQLALELPTGAPVIRKVGAAVDAAAPGAASASQPANDLSAADVDQNILSVVLWLYRRLPRCYGRPPHVEGPVKMLARRVGADVGDCLAERGPDPMEGDSHGQ